MYERESKWGKMQIKWKIYGYSLYYFFNFSVDLKIFKI